MANVPFYKWNIETGDIVLTGTVPDHSVDHQAEPGFGVRIGEADQLTQRIDALGRLVKRAAPEAPDPTVQDVKNEAHRRIEARYPQWKQMNLIRTGGADLDEMTAFIDGVREASGRLDARSRIPSTYRDDRYWP